jgi:hypothetical protein
MTINSFKLARIVNDAAVWMSILAASSSSLGSRARIRAPSEMRPNSPVSSAETTDCGKAHGAPPRLRAPGHAIRTEPPDRYRKTPSVRLLPGLSAIGKLSSCLARM